MGADSQFGPTALLCQGGMRQAVGRSGQLAQHAEDLAAAFLWRYPWYGGVRLAEVEDMAGARLGSGGVSRAVHLLCHRHQGK